METAAFSLSLVKYLQQYTSNSLKHKPYNDAKMYLKKIFTTNRNIWQMVNENINPSANFFLTI